MCVYVCMYVCVWNCNCLCSVGVIENAENKRVWDGWETPSGEWGWVIGRQRERGDRMISVWPWISARKHVGIIDSEPYCILCYLFCSTIINAVAVFVCEIFVHFLYYFLIFWYHCIHAHSPFFFAPFLAGWDLGEKWRGATRLLRIHEGGNGVKKVENHCPILRLNRI